MDISKLSVGKDCPNEVNAIIEIPAGGTPVKYEFDKDVGSIVVDRFFTAPMFYPAHYGFVPHTLADDGDPVDILIYAPAVPIIPGAVIACRPIGVLEMEDDGGIDFKVLAVPAKKMHPDFNDINDISDVPKLLLDQITHFFTHYKELEPGKWAKVGDWKNAQEAKDFITRCIVK